MQAELIHPHDLAELLNGLTKNAVVDVFKPYAHPDDLIEINGKLYLQTTRVPAKTTNIR